MKKLLLPLAFVSLLLFLNGLVPIGRAATATVSGYISCSAASQDALPTDGDAVRKCLDKGGKTVIVLDDTHQPLTIDNPNTVKGQEDHRVLVTGDINAGTIHVYSVRII